MNIIKLNDIIMPDSCRFSKFFNEKLKGKYAYWIKMRFIFPLDSLNYKKYIEYEQMDNVYLLGPNILPNIDMHNEECNMYNFTQTYVDFDATELANSINSFVTDNEYTTDFDIDIEKIRKFRSWLANEILTMNVSSTGESLNLLTNDQIHMLEYYKDGMYNEVVKQLSVFGIENAFTHVESTKTSCNCCNNSSSLYALSNTFTCDALSIYKKNIHILMVQTFENIDFWLKFNINFIKLFKKYVDNIIKAKLIINNEPSNVLYNICKCNESSIDSTNEMLHRLSQSLGYIIDDEVKGHMNFIHDALYEWAEYLYEKMSWEIK